MPRVNHWPAPGPILVHDKLIARPPQLGTYETNFLQMRPYLNSPNPGFPLPGHLTTNTETGPGSAIWVEYGLVLQSQIKAKML